MKKITGICFLLIVLAGCSSIRYFRYISKGKAPKGSFRSEIPFELKNNLIVIKVKLNHSDKEFEFMVDSGAPVSVIYTDALKESKATTVMSYDVSDSQGNAAKSDYVLLDMSIGNLVFKNIFTGYSAAPNEFVACISPGGIIGADLMQTANWQIDFNTRKIIISDLRSSLPSLQDYQKVSFTKRAPFSSVPWLTVLPGMKVDLKIKEVPFTDSWIDLGSAGAITLPKNAVTEKLFKNDLKEVLAGTSSLGLLGAKTDTTFYYHSPDVYLGTVHFNNSTIDIANHNQPLIGTQILSDYILFIDFRKKDLYLKLNLPAENKITDERELGFYMLYDSKSSKCYFASIYEGSSAALSGLHLNDTIVEINRQKTPAFNDFCEFREWRKEMNAQDLVMIKTTRNDQLIKIEKGIIPKK